MAKNKKTAKKAKPTFKSGAASVWDFIKGLFTVKNKKSLRYGAASIVWTALFIAAVVLLNVVAGILTDRFALRADMTADSRYSLSQDTMKVLDGIGEPINLYVFATEDDYRDMVKTDGRYIYGYELAEMLARYEAYSRGKIKVQYIDPYKNPDWVNKYKGQVSVGLYTIVVEQGDKFVSIPVDGQYFWQDSTAAQAAGIFIERRLTLAIDNMDAGDRPLAVIENSKGESVTPELLNMLTEKNYAIEVINTLYDDIPENAELLIISAPQYDFTESEIEKIEKYLAGYKDMIVLLSADLAPLPNFELYLREWGIELGDAVICDSRYNVMGDYSALVTMPTDKAASLPIMNKLGHGQFVIMPKSRPISVIWRDGIGLDNRTCTALLTTSYEAYSKQRPEEGTITSYEKEEGDLDGPFYTAAISTQKGSVDNKEVRANVVVLSSAALFDDYLVNTSSYGNMQLFANTLGEFNPTVNTITIRGKVFTDPELSVYGNARMVILFFLFAVPTACLAMAIVIWVRRKNR